MRLIDTHAHLYTEEFASDADEVVRRALQAGVSKMFLPNIDAASIGPMLALAARHPGVLYPMLGLHPTELTPDYPLVLDEMERRLNAPDSPYIGVGEVGLDYYWSREYYAEQQEVFDRQLGWAARLGLPVMIHARSAHKELVQCMKARCRAGLPRLTGVFHCFGGTRDEAEELLAFDGFALGIGGVLTYKKSTLPEVLAGVPPERIVLETDSPYLAPVPHRGKRNESAHVRHVLQALATLYRRSEEEMAQITTETALRLFPLAR